MQPKQTLRMLLLSLCIPIALGIRFLAVTGRQPNQIPRWVTACVLLYFASVFIYTNVYVRRHRDELRDAEWLERRKESAVKHRRGILNTLFISSMAGPHHSVNAILQWSFGSTPSIGEWILLCHVRNHAGTVYSQ